MWHLRSEKQPTSRCHLRGGRKSRGLLKACWDVQVQTVKQTEAYQRFGHAERATLPRPLLNFLKQKGKDWGAGWQMFAADVRRKRWWDALRPKWNVTQRAHLTARINWGHSSELFQKPLPHPNLTYTPTPRCLTPSPLNHSAALFKTTTTVKLWPVRATNSAMPLIAIQPLSLSLCSPACVDMSDCYVSACWISPRQLEPGFNKNVNYNVWAAMNSSRPRPQRSHTWVIAAWAGSHSPTKRWRKHILTRHVAWRLFSSFQAIKVLKWHEERSVDSLRVGF